MWGEPLVTAAGAGGLLFGNLLGFGGLTAAGVTFWLAVRSERKRRWVRDMPTISTDAVFIGMVEVRGTAESVAPLSSHVEGRACVAYTWQVDERWSRLVTTWETDSNGNRKQVTRRQTGWTTVASGGRRQPFYLRDAAGTLRVDPKGADLQMNTFASVTCSPGHPYYAFGPATAIPDSDGLRRVGESGIPLHADVYVIGFASERADIVAPEIKKHEAADLFLISVHSERVIAARYALGGVAYLVGTIAAASVSLAIRDVMIDSNAGRDMWDHLVCVALVVTPAYLVALAVTVFNSLASLRNMVERGRANIDVQLKRRQDLLPNLEAVVKAHAKHEQEVLNRIVEARAAAADTAKPGSWRAIAPSILLIAERYPSLRANAAFLDLQKHLADTEHRIALARAYYVDLATAYNTRLRIVPDAWIAWLGGLRPAPLLPDAEYERVVERVHLADFD